MPDINAPAAPILRRQDMEEIAEAAAVKAIHGTFALLGVDTANQKSINCLRADFVHAREMRKLTERGKITAFMVIVGAAATAAWVAVTK